MNQLYKAHLAFNTEPSIPWTAAIDRLKLQKRTCSTFIPKETNRDRCICNYDHPKTGLTKFNETWDWTKHTKQEPTNCYGTLPSSNSPYVRCDIDTNIETVCSILLGVWDIAVPGLIMRMIGDVDSTPNMKTEKELLQGIADAAVASDAWIITSGYKEESISELIGEVIYDCRIKNPDINLRAIAVGKWGNIHNCHQLENSCSRNSDNQPTTYKGHGRYNLELNHTHYIFYDDGTCDSLDTGECASNVARQLSYGARRKIPLITILAGGTLHSLSAICLDLFNRIPIVVINGCGSLANILCKYLQLTESSYKLSKKTNSDADNHNEEFNNFEDDMDIAMIDEILSNFYGDCIDDQKNDQKDAQKNAQKDDSKVDSKDDHDDDYVDDDDADKDDDEDKNEDDHDDDGQNDNQNEGNNDNNENSVPPKVETLRDLLRRLGKCRVDFVNDVRKLYNIMRQEQYEAQGKRLPVGGILSLDDEKAFAQCLHQMASCLQDPFRQYIHVFNANSSKSLKETIYYAFVQARDNLLELKKKYCKTIDEQVHLAFRWGIDDATENQPVTSAKIWNDTNKIKQNRSLLIDALNKNLLVFVMNFVKLDIDFTVIFGPNRALSARAATRWSAKYHYLQELYSEDKRKNHNPLYLLDSISTRLNFTEEKHLSLVLEKLVGNFMRPFYKDQSQLGSNSTRTKEDNDDDSNIGRTDAEYIFRDLFLWCILTYRLDMAEIFLSQMRTRICSALIASKILKSLANFAPDQAAKDALYSKADYFETHAIEFVRCAYANDKYQACELIMRRIDLYGGVTCLQMAIVADNKKFLYEDACQALLTNIWYDKVDPVREQRRLLANIFTMGIAQFFISIYDKFYSSRSKIKQENHMIKSAHRKRQLKKTGIDYTDDYDINQSVIQHFFHFHNRPVVKYYYTCLGFVFFLLLFSYFMLSAFAPLSKTSSGIHWTEILTIITITTMLFEELRQIYSQDDRSLMGKIRTYFDLKNRISNLFLALPSYLLFYIGLLLRFTQKDPAGFTSARIVMALDLELWYIRSIVFVGVSSHLGPKIVMIRKMTNDLSLFLLVIVVFIFGYGITSRSLMADGNISISSRQFLYDIIYPVYYFVHGSFDNERSALEAKQDANTFVVAKMMFVFHMLFVNILLLNLLIALFSFTINDVQTQAHYVWAYDRCDIVRTYHDRPALFPPFTFLISMIRCARWCWKKLIKSRCIKRKNPDEDSTYFKMIPFNEQVDHAWSEFERYSTNSYIRQVLDNRAAVLAGTMTADITSDFTTTDSDDLKHIKSLINDVQTNVDDLRDASSEHLESLRSSITELQSKFDQMETHYNQSFKNMDGMRTALNWMMTAMANAKITQLTPPLIPDTSEKESWNQKKKSDNNSNRTDQQYNRIQITKQPSPSSRSTRPVSSPQSKSFPSDVCIEMDQEASDNLNA